jgi:hypothetical protein
MNKLKRGYPEVLAYDKFLDEEVEIDFFEFKMSNDIAKMEINPIWVKIIGKYLIKEEG